MQYATIKQETVMEYQFFKLPKALLNGSIGNNDNVPDVNISLDAACLYSKLLDLARLSQKKAWVDNKGDVYVKFTHEQVTQWIGWKKDKVIKVFKELDEECGVGLIRRVPQGRNRPHLIYVKDFTKLIPDEESSPSENSGTVATTASAINDEQDLPAQGASNPVSAGVGNTDFTASELPTSLCRKNRPHDIGKTDPNKTIFKKNKISNTDSINHAEDPCMTDKTDNSEYTYLHDELVNSSSYTKFIDGLSDTDKKLMTNIMSILYDSLKHPVSVTYNMLTVPYGEYIDRIKKLNTVNLKYVLEKIKSMNSHATIHDQNAYIRTMLYNAPVTCFAKPTQKYDFSNRHEHDYDKLEKLVINK